jgi:preprotein translocase subunit YajC
VIVGLIVSLFVLVVIGIVVFVVVVVVRKQRKRKKQLKQHNIDKLKNEESDGTVVIESKMNTITSFDETNTNTNTNTTTLSTYQPGIHSSQVNKSTNKQTNKHILSSSHTFDI